MILASNKTRFIQHLAFLYHIANLHVSRYGSLDEQHTDILRYRYFSEWPDVKQTRCNLLT